MRQEFICDICGKHLKSAAGLAGHKMLAHPTASVKAEPGASPEEALVEVLGLVKEANDRLEQRLGGFGQQVEGFRAQLKEVNGRLDGFQGNLQTTRSPELVALGDRVKDLEAELAEEQNKTIADFSAEERAQYFVPWLGHLDEDGRAKVSEATGLSLEPVAEVEEEPEVIKGKTDKPGYKFYEYIGLKGISVKLTSLTREPAAEVEEEPEVIKGKTDKPGYKFYDSIGLKGISVKL